MVAVQSRVSPGGTSTGRIHIERGALACEAFLAAEIEREIEAQQRDPSLLARPIRVVVPSRALREHLITSLVDRFGALAGVEIQSLYRLAHEILERADLEPPHGELLVPALVTHLARAEPVLAHELGRLRNGFSVVVAVVSDLLDAGFEAEEREALERRLATSDLSGTLRERAEAVLRVSAGTLAAMREYGIGRTSSLLQLARAVLERDPETLLPTRRLLVYGFADATGVATDLIEALLRTRDAELLIDEPPEPGLQNPNPENEFTQRFVSRLSESAPIEYGDRAPAPPELRLMSAPGAGAELRAVAGQIGALIEAGVRPERIGVVARTLEPYSVALRVQFDRAGIPFSGVGAAGPPGPRRRGLEAVLEVLRRGADTPSDRWLEAREPPRARPDRADLRLALQALGAARVKDIARIELDDLLEDPRHYALPTRLGISVHGDEAGDDSLPRSDRRKVSAELLSRTIASASEFVRACESWPAEADLETHAATLHALLAGPLGWHGSSEVSDDVAEALERLRAEAPTTLSLPQVEFVRLLEQLLEAAGATPIGGRGGGVAVLDVTEARGRCFEQIFLLGMNRDLFPRRISEDPLVPDSVRELLRGALPAIPIKGLGMAEERYLFAQLLHASPKLTLSWQSVDERGRARAPSPWIEGLRLAGAAESDLEAPALFARPGAGEGTTPDGPRSAHEHAILAGLYGSRERFAKALEVAMRERSGEFGLSTPPQVEAAEARMAVLAETDPLRRRTPERLGPYFGFVGRARGPADPRHAELFVTTVESLAACPWRTFIERLLRIVPSPDPLTNLPNFTPLLIGAVVHDALDRITRAVLTELAPGNPALAAVIDASPTLVKWPVESELARILSDAANHVMRKEGIAFPGFGIALAELARPLVERARELDWPGSGAGLPVLASEVRGKTRVSDTDGSEREIHFKADRLDALDGKRTLTDYKTGAPVSTKTKEETRRRKLLDQIASGQRLQGVAYARADVSTQTEGRYLFLREDLDPMHAQVPIQADDTEANERFDAAVQTLLAALDSGTFLPRLVEPGKRDEPALCRDCQVREACVRDDSGARARFESWADAPAPANPSAEPGERLLDLWRRPA